MEESKLDASADGPVCASDAGWHQVAREFPTVADWQAHEDGLMAAANSAADAVAKKAAAEATAPAAPARRTLAKISDSDLQHVWKTYKRTRDENLRNTLDRDALRWRSGIFNGFNADQLARGPVTLQGGMQPLSPVAVFMTVADEGFISIRQGLPLYSRVCTEI
mgnify:CR=1 FL=1